MNTDNAEQPLEAEPGPIAEKYPGCLPIGCLSSFLFVAVYFFLGFYPYIHLSMLAVLGITIWMIIANLRKKRFLNRSVIVAAIPVFALLVGGGLLLPYTSWIPCPSWISRTTVKRSDYRVMATIFGKSLPDSFRITQTRYPGFSLVFNGPDGPFPAGYEVTVNAKDFSNLMQGLDRKELVREDGNWPGPLSYTLFLMQGFHNDMALEYYNSQLDDWNEIWRGKLDVFTICNSWGPYSDCSYVSVDKSHSPNLKVYLATRTPYRRLLN